MDRWTKRFEAGKRAAQFGKGKQSCPYKSDDARGAWMAGWSAHHGHP